MLMTEVISVVAIVTCIVYGQLIKCIHQTKMSLVWNTTDTSYSANISLTVLYGGLWLT